MKIFKDKKLYSILSGAYNSILNNYIIKMNIQNQI